MPDSIFSMCVVVGGSILKCENGNAKNILL
jgi:hypothetical protein